MPNNAELKRATARARRQARRQKAELVANPRVQFADWLKREQPEVYKDAIKYAQASAAQRAGLLQQAAKHQAAKAAGVFDTGLGFLDFLDPVVETTAPVTETADKSFWQKFTEGALAVGTSYLTLKNQKDILELNIERAKLGQPPIDAATSAPVVRTQVGIDPETAAALASNVGAGINKTLMIGGAVALVVLFLIMRK